MARNPWDDVDADVAAMRGGSGGGMSWGKVFVGLIVIGAVTFVGAYYVPLFRAHSTLSKEHQRISDKAQSLDQKLAQAQASLQGMQTKLQSLEAQQSERESGSAKSSAQADSIKAQLGSSLERYAKKGGLVVGKDAESVIVAVSDVLVFSPKKVDVSAQGKMMLCEIAKASGGRPLGVRALDANEEPGPPLSKNFPTAWALRAARAASVADVLSDKCGVQTGRLIASGVGNPDANQAALGAKLPIPRIELAIALGEAKP